MQYRSERHAQREAATKSLAENNKKLLGRQLTRMLSSRVHIGPAGGADCAQEEAQAKRKGVNMTMVTKLGLVVLLILSAAQAHAAPLQMPRIIQGEWCYLGNLPGPESKAALYAPCSEHVGGSGCEDVTISREGYVPGPCQEACRPTSITLTMYGYDVRYQQCGNLTRQLFNFISPDRLVISWL